MKSFTLIELLITIFIITLLVSVGIPAFRKFERRTDLKMTALDIKSTILETKNYALAPKTDGTKINSYGIVFEGPNKYLIKEYGEGTPRIISTATLPKNIQFYTTDWSGGVSPEIKFGVVEQGKITNTTEPNYPTNSLIKIIKSPETPWLIKINQTTGEIIVCEEGKCS